MSPRHPDIDAIVYLGLGIQSNQARLMRQGRFYPDHGLERIVDYHERQDARFAQAAAEISDATGKPILTATELAVAAPGQRRARDGPRDRTPLLSVREPRRHGARPPVAVRPVPPRTRAHLTRRGRATLRAAGAVVLVAAVVCALVAFRNDEPAAATPADDRAATTALLSARRTPFVFADALAQARLRQQLTEFVTQYNGCVAVDDPTVREARRWSASTATSPSRRPPR